MFMCVYQYREKQTDRQTDVQTGDQRWTGVTSTLVFFFLTLRVMAAGFICLQEVDLIFMGFMGSYTKHGGTRCRSWLRHRATSGKVAGSIGIFH